MFNLQADIQGWDPKCPCYNTGKWSCFKRKRVIYTYITLLCSAALSLSVISTVLLVTICIIVLFCFAHTTDLRFVVLCNCMREERDVCVICDWALVLLSVQPFTVFWRKGMFAPTASQSFLTS